MISRIEGELVGVDGGRVELRAGPFTYELLVPACDEDQLADRVGSIVEFHAHHYLEAQGQGASYVPRLIGFASESQRRFFEVLTSVKGLGMRKALRALRVPHHTIAEAIAAKDLDLLVTLPEIGRRLAETMVAELNGRIDRFIEPKVAGAEAGAPTGSARDAIAVLIQVGEPAREARRLVERALAANPGLDSPDAIVSAAYALREPA